MGTTHLYAGALRGYLGCSQGTECIPTLVHLGNAMMGCQAAPCGPGGLGPQVKTLPELRNQVRPSAVVVWHKV